MPCPTPAGQILLCLAPDASSFKAWIRLYERDGFQAPWRSASPWLPALLGRSGLAWGIGLHPPQPGRQKQEGDGASPEGRFRLGWILGEEDGLPKGARWPWYHRKTPWDAWVDDPSLPGYNHLVSFPQGTSLPWWFSSQRMSLGIAARKWMILVEHNYPQAVPGRGSAIFLHAWSDPEVPSEGCTMVAMEDLYRILLWLDPGKNPELVQLDLSSYLALWAPWGLPSPRELSPWPPSDRTSANLQEALP